MNRIRELRGEIPVIAVTGYDPESAHLVFDASPPDNPQSGEDVFDVYSLAEGVGLNGIPYRQW